MSSRKSRSRVGIGMAPIRAIKITTFVNIRDDIANSLAIGMVANDVLKKRGEKKLFDPEEMVATSDSHFSGRSKPLKDTHFHAFLNMDMALQKSSNIYMARLVDKIIARLGIRILPFLPKYNFWIW